MNIFSNPVFLLRIARSYLSDRDRVWHYNGKKLKEFQDKAIKKMIKYAFNVPLYRKIYKKQDIHPNDIKRVEDIQKLPFITKNDLRKNFPHDIVPEGKNIKKFWRIETSGNTGKPLFLFRDLVDIVREEILGIRCLMYYGYELSKDRFTVIGDYVTPGRYDYAVYKGILENLKGFLPMKNIQYVSYFLKDTESKIEQINKFNPTFLYGFPGDIKTIATYKQNGYATFSPKCIITSGENLDSYTKEYIENIFNTRVYDIYTSIEMGTGAFQCEYGNYHVNSDNLYLEFLNDEKKPVNSNEPGHVVMTKLFGRGTPLIRYTGLGDIITPLYEKCPCGLETMLFKNIVGRKISHIILPDGKNIAPYAITAILYKIMHRLKYYKIEQYQIVQKKIDRIEVNIVLQNEEKDKKSMKSRLFFEIRKEYQKIFGPEIEILVKEEKEIKSKSDKPSPTIISKVHSDF